jgi:hypothetical protein
MAMVRKFEVISDELSLYSICTSLKRIFRKVNEIIKIHIPPSPNVALLASSFLRFLNHTQRRTAVGRLPWMSDQPDAETSTGQHSTLTEERHTCPRRDSNPQSQQASDGQPTPWTARQLGPDADKTRNYCNRNSGVFTSVRKILSWEKCFNSSSFAVSV